MLDRAGNRLPQLDELRQPSHLLTEHTAGLCRERHVLVEHHALDRQQIGLQPRPGDRVEGAEGLVHEDHIGRDLVILSADPLATARQDLREIEVLQTIKDGEVVFRR